MIEQDLQKLGFAKNEITVYVALFELGKSRAGKIIEYTGLHRNLVYTALDELVKKDVVAKTERGKVAVFEANSPKFLKDGLEKQMHIADAVIDELKKKQTIKPRDISVSEGMEGVFLNREKAAQELKAGETYYVLGISEKNTRPEFDSFFAKLNKKILDKGAKVKALFGSASKEMITRRALTYGDNAKPLPFGADSPMWFTFYKDILNISVADSDPVTFSIRSQQAVDGFKKYFEYFWNQPVRMESGMDALHRVFHDMLNEMSPGEEYYVFGTVQAMDGQYRDFFDHYHRARIKKGVAVKMLSYREHLKEIKDRFFAKCGDPEGKISHIKAFVSAPPIPMQITLYKGKARMLFSGAEPTVFYFEQPEVFEGFKKYFDEIWNQDSYILRGPEAVRDLWIESVDTGELRYIGARGYFIDRFPKLWAEVKAKTALNKNYAIKNIVDPGVRGHEITRLPCAQTKYLLTTNKNPNVVWLFGNKVAVANWDKDEPVVFISENRGLVQSYNDYFQELWNQDKVTYTGQDSVEGVYNSIFDIVSKDDSVIIFAAKPTSVRAAGFNVQWAKQLSGAASQVRFLYYGLNDENKKRAKEMIAQGCEARIISTPQSLPISTVVAKDVVLNTVWQEPTACFKMNNATVADSYRSNFELLWRQALKP